MSILHDLRLVCWRCDTMPPLPGLQLCSLCVEYLAQLAQRDQERAAAMATYKARKEE